MIQGREAEDVKGYHTAKLKVMIFMNKVFRGHSDVNSPPCRDQCITM